MSRHARFLLATSSRFGEAIQCCSLCFADREGLREGRTKHGQVRTQIAVLPLVATRSCTWRARSLSPTIEQDQPDRPET